MGIYDNHDAAALESIFWALIQDNIDSARDVLEWADWDLDQWAIAFMDDIVAGDYDDNLKDIYNATVKRLGMMGVADPKELHTPNELVAGQNYVIQTSRNSKWNGVIVRLVQINTGTAGRHKSILVYIPPAKRSGVRGRPLRVGSIVNVYASSLRKWDGIIPAQCAGFNGNGCLQDAPTGSELCYSCQRRKQDERDNQARRLALEQKQQQEQQAEEKAAREEAERVRRQLKEKRSAVVGKRRVIRRG